jgi:hypothetical protein
MLRPARTVADRIEGLGVGGSFMLIVVVSVNRTR